MHDHIVLTELLEDENFLTWVRKRNTGDRMYWDNWVEMKGCHKQLIDQAIALLEILGQSETEVSDAHVKQSVNTALIKAKQQERQSHWLFQPALRRIAAAVLLLSTLTWSGYILKYRNDSKTESVASSATQQTKSLIETANTGKALKYVQLPDGSSVVLHQGGSLRFPEKFTGTKREVYLSGEAFFEVTKDPAHPFLVYSNGLVTKVYGTSFSIRSAPSSKHVVVLVKTGKVSLFADQDIKTSYDRAPLILTPNQKAEFDPSQKTLRRITPGKNRQELMRIEEQAFTYSSTPVSQVFDALESAYGIQIDFDREKMAACSITAMLGDEPLENKLKWLCTILEASYRMERERIIITGKNCQ